MTKFKFFIEKLRFKYRLSILNENTLEEEGHIRFSRLDFFAYLFVILVIIFLINFFLIIKTPLKKFVPGYLDMEIRPQLINEALRTDSIIEETQKNDDYILAIKDFISGNIAIDSNDTKNQLLKKEYDFQEKSKKEAEFCEQYENNEKDMLSVDKTENPNDQTLFNTPAHGVVTEKFGNGHNGVDILVQPNESIRCIADGYIISEQYTLEDGYVIIIQHDNNFISIYKRNSMFLKKIGDRVKAGESIAIASNLFEEKENEKIYLHFELWRDGKPQNPENFILF